MSQTLYTGPNNLIPDSWPYSSGVIPLTLSSSHLSEGLVCLAIQPEFSNLSICIALDFTSDTTYAFISHATPPGEGYTQPDYVEYNYVTGPI